MSIFETFQMILIGALPIIGFMKKVDSFKEKNYPYHKQSYFITLTIFLAIPLGLAITGDETFLWRTIEKIVALTGMTEEFATAMFSQINPKNIILSTFVVLDVLIIFLSLIAIAINLPHTKDKLAALTDYFLDIETERNLSLISMPDSIAARVVFRRNAIISLMIMALVVLVATLFLLPSTVAYCILLLPLFFLLGNLHALLGPILAGFSLATVIYGLLTYGFSFTLDSIIGWSNVFSFLDISSVGVKIVFIGISTALGVSEFFLRLLSEDNT